MSSGIKYNCPSSICKLNRLLCLRLDLTNHRDKGEIDFISAFEKYYTLDRAILELNRCQCSTDGYAARTAVFSTSDKFSELISMPGMKAEKIFHHFFTKQFRDRTLIPQLRSYQQPFGDYFKDEAVRIYDKLYEVVLGKEGLWMSYRRTNSGIEVREWDKTNGKFIDSPNALPEDEFVGEIIRMVRNTHHGYISYNDKRRRFATFASLHTTNLPDAFTAIPQFLWLMILNSPETTILSGWISDETLQSATI